MGGAINTGSVQQIDVALSHIKVTGNPQLEQTLADFNSRSGPFDRTPNTNEERNLRATCCHIGARRHTYARRMAYALTALLHGCTEQPHDGAL